MKNLKDWLYEKMTELLLNAIFNKVYLSYKLFIIKKKINGWVIIYRESNVPRKLKREVQEGFALSWEVTVLIPAS